MGSWTGALNVLMNGNQLNGTLPESIGAWSIIEAFGIGIVAEFSFGDDLLYSNNIGGPLPDSIGNWAQITSFDVSGKASSCRLCLFAIGRCGAFYRVECFRVSHRDCCRHHKARALVRQII